MSSKGTLNTGAAGRAPPENLRSTRSQTVKTSMQLASTSPQAATLEKKKAKAKELELEARKLLQSEECLTDETKTITHGTILNMLTLIIQKYSVTTPQGLAKALTSLATLLKQVNAVSSTATQLETVVDALSQEVGERIAKTMQEEMEKMSVMIKCSLTEQCKALSPPEDLAETVTTLKKVATDMSKSITDATTATLQINDTALNYKQALIGTTAQETQVPQTQQARAIFNNEHAMDMGRPTHPYATERYDQVDPKILRDMDRKARQILIETLDPNITGASQAEIKEKVSAAIAKIADPAPPKDTTILEVSKIRKGGFTILFKDKEVVSWLQDPGAEFEFTSEVSRDASIIKRSYSLLVPRIPLSFDPTNDDHLREIEECNGIPAETITKARWIKPVNRRMPGQRAAHTVFTFNDITTANEHIRDGLKICGLHIRPSRLKHEPMQCMKCRRWGHFAHACIASADTCGTCGEEHRTNTCNSKEKTFCVSCQTNTHASWDRECPEFRRRCNQFDENYPENNLPYFPSDEKWTLTPRPGKIPRTEKFPSKYAVATTQQPEHAERGAQNKSQSKHPKQRMSKVPPNQSTMDQYITTGNPRKMDTEITDSSTDADTAAHTDSTYPTLNYITPEEGLEPQGWD